MNIYYSPYSLKFRKGPVGRAAGAQREGALLCVEENGIRGYADLHPWPELGDLCLNDQLSGLRKGETSALSSRSLFFARQDRLLKERGKVFAPTKENSPRNHYFVSAGEDIFESRSRLIELFEAGFERIKVKLEAENVFPFFKRLREHGLSCLEGTPIKFRVDCNDSFQTRQNFEACLAEWAPCEGLLDRVDFFEDPFPFNFSDWAACSENYDLRLALDRGSPDQKASHDERIDKGTSAFAVAVIKGAIEDSEPIVQTAALEMRRVLFTSYLDHPVGTLSSMCLAMECANKHPHLLEDCGFLSHHLFEDNAFSERLQVEDSRLLIRERQTGWGFEDLLEGLEWKKL